MIRNCYEAFDFTASRFIHAIIRKGPRDHAYFTLVGCDLSLPPSGAEGGAPPPRLNNEEGVPSRTTASPRDWDVSFLSVRHASRNNWAGLRRIHSDRKCQRFNCKASVSDANLIVQIPIHRQKSPFYMATASSA